MEGKMTYRLYYYHILKICILWGSHIVTLKWSGHSWAIHEPFMSHSWAIHDRWCANLGDAIMKGWNSSRELWDTHQYLLSSRWQPKEGKMTRVKQLYEVRVYMVLTLERHVACFHASICTHSGHVWHMIKYWQPMEGKMTYRLS